MSRMCEVAQILEEKGRTEGRKEGQDLLVAVVNRMRDGETKEQIAASGVDAETIAYAESIVSKF